MGNQHVVAVHPLFPGYYVHGGVGSGMSYMQPVARGIGELNQAVELRLGGIASLAAKVFSSFHLVCHFFSISVKSYFKVITLSCIS